MGFAGYPYHCTLTFDGFVTDLIVNLEHHQIVSVPFSVPYPRLCDVTLGCNCIDVACVFAVEFVDVRCEEEPRRCGGSRGSAGLILRVCSRLMYAKASLTVPWKQVPVLEFFCLYQAKPFKYLKISLFLCQMDKNCWKSRRFCQTYPRKPHAQCKQGSPQRTKQ